MYPMGYEERAVVVVWVGSPTQIRVEWKSEEKMRTNWVNKKKQSEPGGREKTNKHTQRILPGPAPTPAQAPAPAPAPEQSYIPWWPNGRYVCVLDGEGHVITM
jgi:hypothetical protein